MVFFSQTSIIVVIVRSKLIPAIVCTEFPQIPSGHIHLRECISQFGNCDYLHLLEKTRRYNLRGIQ